MFYTVQPSLVNWLGQVDLILSNLVVDKYLVHKIDVVIVGGSVGAPVVEYAPLAKKIISFDLSPDAFMILNTD